MKMELNVIKQEYAIFYESVFPNCDIAITWNELREAEIGKTWSTEDGDKYVNCECFAQVTVVVVYKNEEGAAVLTRVAWDDGETKCTLTWYDFT